MEGKRAEKILVSALIVGTLLFFLSCKAEEPAAPEIKRVELISKTEDGKTVSIPNDYMSFLVKTERYEALRTESCGKNGCKDELEKYKDSITFNTLVIFSNVMILLKRLDTAVLGICTFALFAQDERICPSQAPVLPKTVRLEEHQETDVIDTLLGLVNLKREELTALMEEVILASENYRNIEDNETYVFRLTTPLNVRVGNIVNVWFKEGTEIRYDLITVIGAVSQAVAALLNVLNSHNWMLDISGVLRNASDILRRFREDPPAFVRDIPGLLGINEAPRFLRFVENGAEIWKKIPSNISLLLRWGSDGIDYFFKTPCKADDVSLVCWDSAKKELVFRFDGKKKNIVLGKEEDGRVSLPAGFSDKTAEEIVSVLRSGGDKFDCSKDDNYVYVAEKDKFDMEKVVKAFWSISAGEIKDIGDVPNFARIDFCKLFGVEGAEPIPIRDLMFPKELNTDGGEVEAGVLFAFEAEGVREFVFATFTTENTSGNPLYYKEVTQKSYFFLYDSKRYQIGFQTNAIAFYIQDNTIYIPPEGVTPVSLSSVGDLFLMNLFSVPSEYVGLLIPPVYIKDDYVGRGDGHRFRGKLRRDYFEPLTSVYNILGEKIKIFTKYPEDVFSLEGKAEDILGQFGEKAIPYLLLKERNDLVLNGAAELDNCMLIWYFANRIKEKSDTAKLLLLGGIITPFVTERVLGKDYEKKISSGEEEALSESVVYLRDSTSACGIVGTGTPLVQFKIGYLEILVPAEWDRDYRGWKFIPATNQILNDFIAMGLFILASEL